MPGKNNICVDILLSTYNGEKYVAAQIESLLLQSHQNWRLLIRDDGSKDKTVAIIKKYIDKYPQRIFYHGGQKPKRNLGVVQSFAKLLRAATSDYICFCDQDDIWLPKKIEITLKKLMEMEKHYGRSTPLLVHTDLRVVDAKINVIAPSFWKLQNIDPKIDSMLNRLLMQNVVTGCTMMVNVALKKMVSRIPKEALMHDWWLALVAGVFGKIGYINTATILYRQHGENIVGAKRSGNIFVRKIWPIKVRKRLLHRQKQAKAFLRVYQKTGLTKQEFNVLHTFAGFYDFGFFKRRYFILKYSYYMTGFLKNLAVFLFC